MIFSSIKNKALRITACFFTGLLLLVILLLLAVNIYIAFNKQTLLSNVKKAIDDHTSGKLEIKDIDISTISSFPNIAVDLENVELIDSVYKKPLLKCRVLSCRINMFKVGDIEHQLSKIVLEDGLISLYTDSTGYSNLSIFSIKGKEKKGKDGSFVIHTIVMGNMDLVINNDQKEKDFEFHIAKLETKLNEEDTVLEMEVNQKTLIKKMTFDREQGSFLENNPVNGKLRPSFNNVSKTLTCEKCDLEVNEQKYTIGAVFRFGQDPSFHLDIAGNKIRFEKSIAALKPKLSAKLSAIQLKEPLAVQAMLDGSLGPRKIPVVSVKWQTKNNQLSSGPVSFDECSFTGNFTNNIADTLPHTDEFSRITIQAFSGKWNNLLLTGKDITVTNLLQPVIEFDLSSFSALTDIDNALGSEAIRFQEGTASVILSYNGPLIPDPAQLKNLIAGLQIKSGKILYEPKNILLENCSGFMSVGENRMLFKDFQFDFKKTHFTVNVAGNKMSGLSENTNYKAALAFNIYTPFLNLDEIFQVLAPPQKNADKKRKANFAAAANKIDQLFANSNWIINFSADTVRKELFYAEKLKIALTMQENNWQINELSMYHAGGSVSAKGHLSQRDAKTSTVSADIKLEQLNIEKLLTAFNNFGQTSITANNLRGVLDADAHISMAMNTGGGGIIPRSMTGVLNFSLKNGAIVNHKGLQEMKLLFLQNRDMSNIRFAELKDRIDITPQYLYINRMEIQSTAVNLFVEGQYDIYGKNTDLQIQVPLNNFGKRDAKDQVKNKGVNAKTGLSLLLAAKNNEQGEIKFTPRLSRKKEKKSK